MLSALLLAAAALADVSGVVYLDRNANGRRDASEPGLPGVVVSDQVDVVVTDHDGAFRIPDSHGFGLVFVSVPDGYRAVGSFWRRTADGVAAFGLARAPVPTDFTFVHASDTHISPATQVRTERFRALVDSLKPDFAIVTGDLVRDALRVGEAEATSYYQLFQTEAARFTVPLYTVPGNHENFGIERSKSHVSADNPLYGRAMYHHFRGPDYYSFNYGGIHFVGLNSVDIADTAYYGHVDSVQVAWLARDLAQVPATTPVVTFNHIPFFTSYETVYGFMDGPPAPSTITVDGKLNFRHTVRNAGQILATVAPHPYPMAIAGHMHVRERIQYEGVPTRFYQTAAIVGPNRAAGQVFTSGFVVYHVTHGQIDDGTFIPLGDVGPSTR